MQQEKYTLLNTTITLDNHNILFALIEEDGTERLEKRLKAVMDLYDIDEVSAMYKAEEALYRAGGDFTDGELMSGMAWLGGEDIVNLTYMQ